MAGSALNHPRSWPWSQVGHRLLQALPRSTPVRIPAHSQPRNALAYTEL